MTKRLTALALATVIALVVRGAQADCDYESHHLNTHNGVVPEWSYSHVVERGATSVWPDCEAEAEATRCVGLTGLGCAAEMQRLYSSCVSRQVCDSWVQGQLEDGHLGSLEASGQAYRGCVALVVSAGGEF